jgi:hypothetical protein
MVYPNRDSEKYEKKERTLSEMGYLLSMAAHCNMGLLFYTYGKKDSKTLEFLKNGKEFCKGILRGAYLIKGEKSGAPALETIELEDYKFARSITPLTAKWQFYDLVEKAKEIGSGLDAIIEGKEIQKDKLDDIGMFFIQVNTILGRTCSRLSKELQELKYPYCCLV